MGGAKDENDRLANGTLPDDPADDVEPIVTENAARVTGTRLAGSTKGRPSNLEAEIALLSAMLWSGKFGHATTTVAIVRDILDSGDKFFSRAHQHIYAAMLAIEDGTGSPDPVTIHIRLREQGHDRAAGGVEYLDELVASAAATSDEKARVYAQAIRDTWMLRQMIDAGEKIIASARSTKSRAVDVLDLAHSLVTGIAGHASSNAEDERLDQVVKRICSLASSPVKRGAIQTGFRVIDKSIPGLFPREVSIVAARTSVGKSMWTTQMAFNVVTKDPSMGVEYISLEMRSDLFVERLLSSQSGVSHRVFRAADAGVCIDEQETVGFTKRQWSAITDAVNRFGASPIYFSKSQSQTIMSIHAIANRRAATLAREGKRLSLLVIDHIGLVKPPAGQKRRERRDEVAETSRALRWLAEQHNCHVIGICQINREVEKGKGDDKIPQLHHLKDSGAIEDDSDNVFLIHREKDKNGMFISGKPVLLRLAKGRSDGKFNFLLGLNEEFMQFTDWIEPEPQRDDPRDFGGGYE